MDRSRPLSRSQNALLVQRQPMAVHNQLIALPFNNAPPHPLLSQSQSTATLGELLNTRKECNARRDLLHKMENKFNIKEVLKAVPVPLGLSASTTTFGEPERSTDFQSSIPSSALPTGRTDTPLMTNAFDMLTPLVIPPNRQFEDSTCGTGRSLETDCTGSNSLFKTRDDGSIDRYMTEILAKGSPSKPGTPGKLGSKPGSKPGSPQTGLLSKVNYVEDAEAAVHYSLRCNNLSSWTISSSSARVHAINFKIIEDVIYRESLILKMTSHLAHIDSKYWMYCIERIKFIEAGKLLHNEALVMKRNELFIMQQKLSVEIAHLRSLSISILEHIKKIRVLISNEINMNASVSVYWKESNYMLKIASDCAFLSASPAVRYWYGFPPNPLMVPPNEHNPYQFWKLQTGLLFSQWLSAHKEKVSKDKKGTKHRRGYIIQDTKFLFDNLQLLQDVEKNDIARIASHDHGAGDEEIERRSSSRCASPMASRAASTSRVSSPMASRAVTAEHRIKQQLQQQVFEPWEQLRDYCDYSWGSIDHVLPEHMDRYLMRNSAAPHYIPASLLVQSADTAQFFWNNPNHNPFVVEAAIGFAEVFPSIYLVPPFGNDLRRKCNELMLMLDKEHELHLQLDHKKAEMEVKKAEYESMYAGSASLLESSVLEDSAIVKTRELLKLRHQADSQLLSGISSKYINDQTNAAYQPENSLMGSPLPLDSSMLYAGEQIFSLTDDHRPGSRSMVFGGSLAEDKVLNPATASASLCLMQDMSSAFPTFTLEASQSTAKTMIVNRVRETRSLIRHEEQDTLHTHSVASMMSVASTASMGFSEPSFNPMNQGSFSSIRPTLLRGASFVRHEGNMKQMLLRPDRRGKREVHRLDPKWNHRHAVQIQRIIRGYLARRYVGKMRRKRKWKRTVVKLQSVVRGFVHRLQANRKEQALQMETFILRKQAMKRFRAAITIARCIRRAVNVYRLKKQEPLLMDKLSETGQLLTKRQSMMRLRSSMNSTMLDLLGTESAKLKAMLMAEDDDDLDWRRSNHSLDSRAPSPVPSLSRNDSAMTEDNPQSRSTTPAKQRSQTPDASHEAAGGDHESECSQSSIDESERRRMLKTRAVALIKKVNAGKVLPDTMRDSRLVPIEAASPHKKLRRRPKFSTKQHTFLASESAPQSIAHSTAEVYVPPKSLFGKHVPKGTVVYKSAEELKREKDDREAAKFNGMLQGVFG